MRQRAKRLLTVGAIVTCFCFIIYVSSAFEGRSDVSGPSASQRRSDSFGPSASRRRSDAFVPWASQRRSDSFGPSASQRRSDVYDPSASKPTNGVYDGAVAGIKKYPKSPPSEVPAPMTPLKINPQLNHERWIVVTSIAPPTDDVIALSRVPGWKLVVVGDTKSPKNWSLPNTVFLSISDQESLGLATTKHLEYRNYARKNVGYLFALAHGARVIYETDDDNRPLDDMKSFHHEKTFSGLMFSGRELFNPYRHFGQITLWPRGYPLGYVGDPKPVSYRLSDKWKTPIILQGVVNGDPDMDAVFRLTRKKTLERLEVIFDPAAPPVILPEGVFSPYNCQNTVHLYEAMWALLLPPTVNLRTTDIYRGYWAQRLMWEIGGHLGFFPPYAYQKRNAHSYMQDAADEDMMYFDTERLLKFLSSWICPPEFPFFQCMSQLRSEMADQKFWGEAEADLVNAWIQDLKRIGYPEPVRVPVQDAMKRPSDIIRSSNDNTHQTFTSSIASDIERRWAATTSNGTHVNFVAKEQESPEIRMKPKVAVSNVAKHASQVLTLCKQTATKMTLAANSNTGCTFFDDVLLIVLFNWPHYSNIRYTDVAYRHLFPNIAYCGDNVDNFQSFTARFPSEVTFIGLANEALHGGNFAQECLIRAMQMGYNVTGYFVTNDDLLLNVWKFYDMDKTRVWSQLDESVWVEYFNLGEGLKRPWWNSSLGGDAYKAALKGLNEMSVVPQGVTDAKQFLATLSSNVGGPGRGVYYTIDVYYIPARLRNDALFYLNQFRYVHNEIAIPTVLHGLESTKNIQSFRGVDLKPGSKARENPWANYSADSHFLHPIKMSDRVNLLPYCTTYLANLLLKGHVCM